MRHNDVSTLVWDASVRYTDEHKSESSIHEIEMLDCKKIREEREQANSLVVWSVEPKSLLWDIFILRRWFHN